jgi:hypothetical protein
MPLRDQSLTVLPRFSVIRRKPSHLVSKTHFLSSKGFVTERRQHRSIGGIHALSSGLSSTLALRQESVETVSFALSDVHSFGFDVVPTVRRGLLCKVPKHLDAKSAIEIVHDSLFPGTTNDLGGQASRCARLRHNVIGELKGSLDYFSPGEQPR